MLAEPQVGLARMSRRILITGLSSYWGGRLAQVLETRPRQRGDHRRLARGPGAAAGAHGVRPRRHAARAAAPDRPRRRDRHGDRHAPGRGLQDRAGAGRARDERARDDEHPRGLRRAGLARDASSSSSPPRTTTAASATTRASSPRRCSARTRRARVWSPTSSRPRTPCRSSRPATRRSRSRRCASATASGPDLDTSHSALLGLPGGARASSASTRATSSSTRTTSSARCTTRSSNDLPGIHNAAPDGVLALSEVASLLGKPFAPLLPPLGTGLADRGDGQDRDQNSRRSTPAAALRSRPGQPQAQAVRLPLRAHDARDGAGIRRRAAAETAARERRGAISIRARSRGVPALVAERPARRVRQLTRSATLQGYAGPPRGLLPSAHPMRTRLIVLAAFSAAPRPRWRGRRVLLRRLQAGPDRRGREGQRRPDRRDDAGAGGEEALRDAARPARPPGQGPLQGPHLHAVAEGGVDRDRHPRLRGQGAQALAGGGHVLPHVAQRAQQVAEHRARGRGVATTSRRSASSSSACSKSIDRKPVDAKVDLIEGPHRPSRAPRPACASSTTRWPRTSSRRCWTRATPRRSRSRRRSCSPRSRPSSSRRSIRRS